MIRFMKNDINLAGIRSIRSFSANRFKTPKFFDKSKGLKREELESKKAEVEKFRANFWRKHDKKYYFGAFTFVLHKQKDIKEAKKDINYEEEFEKETRSGKL